MSTNPIPIGAAPTAALPNLRPILAALPAAIDTAMQKTLPRCYTPELARQIADTMAAVLIEDQQVAEGAR